MNTSRVSVEGLDRTKNEVNPHKISSPESSSTTANKSSSKNAEYALTHPILYPFVTATLGIMKSACSITSGCRWKRLSPLNSSSMRQLSNAQVQVVSGRFISFMGKGIGTDFSFSAKNWAKINATNIWCWFWFCY